MKTEFLGLLAGIVLIGCSKDEVKQEELVTVPPVVEEVPSIPCDCYTWVTMWHENQTVRLTYKQDFYSNKWSDNLKYLGELKNQSSGLRYQSWQVICEKK